MATSDKKPGRKKQNSSVSLPHGRKRTVSPGFFTDSTLLALSPLHRLFFEGLWAYADRAGRLLDRPIDLKIRILPMDAFDPEKGLNDLAAVGLIRRYVVGGQRFIAMKERPWVEVQRLHPDEPESAIPPPPNPDPGPKGISVHGNTPADPISVIGNRAVDPISGPDPDPISGPGSSGPAGSSCLRDPRDLLPPNPPRVAKGEPERSCTCTRRPCRHERPLRLVSGPDDGIIKREVRTCVVCAAPAEAEIGEDVPACYPCIGQFRRYCEAEGIERPWEHAEAWVEAQRLSAAESGA